MSSAQKTESNSARRTARLLLSAAALLVFVWCAWWALGVGLSRLVARYGLAGRVAAASDLAVRFAPSDPEAHYKRAQLLNAAGDYAGALRSYEEAARLRPSDYVIWQELGKVREQTGDTEGALEAFREAVRLAPFYAQPRWQLGNTLLRAGRREEAFAELRRAAESDPKLYRNLLQAVWYSSGKDARSLAELAPPRAPEETLALARFLVRNGEAAEALKLYRGAGAQMPEAARRTMLAELIKAGRFAEAREVWDAGRGQSGGSSGRGLITDGGFEETRRTDEGGFAWRFVSEQPGIKASLDSAGPREGARSLRLELAGESQPSTRLLSQLVLAEPGARYRLEFAARVRDLVTGGPFVVIVTQAAGDDDAKQLAATPPLPTGTTEGWQDFALEFAVPEGAQAVRIVVRRQECESSPCPAFGSLWLDGFGLKKL